MRFLRFFTAVFFTTFSLNSLIAQEWEIYTRENSPLISNTVLSVCVDSNGIKWFGTFEF